LNAEHAKNAKNAETAEPTSSSPAAPHPRARPAARFFARVAAPLALAAAPLALAALALAGMAGAASGPVALKTTEFGHGPTVVLVHGLGAARMGWMPAARRLLANYHVVLVDLPGHGESALPDPFSLEAAAASLDLVLAKQNAESTVVVGQGVGGLLALMAASMHPEHQRGLVLIDVTLRSPIPVDDQMKSHFVDFMDQNYDQVLRLVFMKMGRDSAQGVAIHAVASQVPQVTIKSYMRELLSVDGGRSLKGLKTPMLLVLTDHALPEGKTWPEVSKAMGWDDPAGVTTRHIAKAAGLIASDQPDTLATVISQFAQQALARR